MFKKMLTFIFLPVFLTTIGEFFLKHNINQLSTSTFNTGNMSHILSMVADPGVLIGLGCILVGGFLWVIAMSKFELSFLYPFLSINYITIVVGSHFFLKEDVSIFRYMSIVLIIIGLIFISRSPYSESQQS